MKNKLVLPFLPEGCEGDRGGRNELHRLAMFPDLEVDGASYAGL